MSVGWSSFQNALLPPHNILFRALRRSARPTNLTSEKLRQQLVAANKNTMLFGLLSTVFANKLVEDERVPIPLVENVGGFRIGVLPMELAFHGQMLVLLLAQMALLLVIGIIMWYVIVAPMKQSELGKASLSSLFVGLGLVIPASLVLPFWIFDAMDLRSHALRFGCLFIPLTIPFKCLDALFGVDSEGRRLRTASFRHYKYYVSCMLPPKYAVKKDDNHQNGGASSHVTEQQVVVPCTRKSIMDKFVKFNVWFFVSILYYQVFQPFNFAPFPERDPERDPATDLYPTFELGRLCNNYIQFLGFFISVFYAFYGVGMHNELVARVQVHENPFAQQPLFLATSPSDFGRRWNSLIHHNLKEGVYKPVRAAMGWKHPLSKATATFATFTASALIHEYVWSLLLFRTTQDKLERDECLDCFEPVFGKSLVFFGWCCLWVILEESFVGNLIAKTMGPALRRYLPRPLFGALLVLFIGCPTVHLFTECLVYGKYFDQLILAGPWLVFERASK